MSNEEKSTLDKLVEYIIEENHQLKQELKSCMEQIHHRDEIIRELEFRKVKLDVKQ